MSRNYTSPDGRTLNVTRDRDTDTFTVTCPRTLASATATTLQAAVRRLTATLDRADAQSRLNAWVAL